MKDKMYKRIKKDGAAGITFYGIFAILIIMLLGIWIVDINKNLMVSKQYQMAAQRAVQTAVKDQDKIGGISPDAINTVINEYMVQTNPSVDPTKPSGEKQVFSQACRDSSGGKLPKITVYFDTRRDKRAGEDNFETSYQSRNYQSVEVESLREEFRRKNYQVVAVRVEDAVQDFFSGMFGPGCQKITVDASAITSSSRDEDKFLKIREP